MRYEAFEERAWELWEQIPEGYKSGVDGLVIEREARAHPSLDDIYTLGECITEAYPSDFGGPDTVRSFVVLYYGSFWRLSRLDPDFGWEDELWETLTHELQHHLESLATEDELIAMDYAADENFKRLQGERFDPDFYRSGEPVAADVWRVEGDHFVERVYGAEEAAGEWLRFEWQGRSYRARWPRRRGDVCFLRVTGGMGDAPAGELTLVAVRRRRWTEALGGWLRRRPLAVMGGAVRAEPEPDRGAGGLDG
jgi:hypothetical protein